MKEKLDIEQARDIWNEPVPEIDSASLDREFEHLHAAIRHSRIRKMTRGGIVVLCALILTGGGFFLNKQSASAEKQPAYIEYVANTGETRNVTLSDGTTVYLNSQSRLFCASTFEKSQTRDVFLCGEAFFEVSKDVEHPFIVHAAGSSIKVTGTKFNVRAFLDESNFSTTLIEGGVEVSVPGLRNPIHLIPGKSLDVSGSNVNLFDVDTNSSIGWYKGDFNAYHKTLLQICRDLERRFGVSIVIADEEIASKMFYASFVNNENVDDILDALNVQKDFRLKKQDKYYLIFN